MAEPTLAPGTRVGEYVVAERLGVGGFSEVFRATHPVLRREVALKVLDRKYCDDQGALNRFIDEARATNLLQHRGVVDVFGFGELDDGRVYYAMELLPGKTLAALLAERTRLPLAEALPILRGIAEAVDAAHAAGIAHRDLKPDNVFVLPDGSTKLIDFGIAKLVRDASRVATETGSVLGTPQYMSPEQCRGRGSDTRSDAYSFGALAYHVLVGEPPFAGEPLEIALHHLNDRPVAPSKRAEVPQRVDRVVLALLEKDPALRPMPLASAVDALGGARLKRRWSSRVKLLALGVGVAVVGVVAVGVTISSRPPEHEAAPVLAPATDECKPAARRLANVWDAGVRSTLAARFTARDDARRWWAETSDTLDRFASAWSVEWDVACHHPDGARDSLRHAQRMACLENALFDLRAGVDTIGAIEVSTFVDGFDASGIDGLRGRKLVDCSNPRVLRAQVGAPPVEHRDRVAVLLREASRAYVEAGIAFARRATADVDRALDRHAAIAREVETLDAPSAAMLIAERASMLGAYASEVDQQRRPAARKALLDGLQRIESSGDSVAIAFAYLALGYLELVVGDGDPAAKTDALIARIETAVQQAGAPVLAQLGLELLRGQLAMLQGRYQQALIPLRAADQLARVHGGAGANANAQRLLAQALIEAGHVDAAIEESSARMKWTIARHGEAHARSAQALLAHAIALDAAGKLEESLATRGKVAQVMHHLGSHAPIWTRAYMLDLELHLGRKPADIADTLRVLANRGTTPPRHNPDGPATARRAGMFEAFVYGAEHPGITDEDRRLDHLAVLAFQRGDREAMARHARAVVARCQVTSCSDWIRFSRWLAALASKPIDAELAALEKEYGNDKSALAYSGIVLASLDRWDDARKKLEAARGAPHIWESQTDLTELDGWLGLARLRAGDVRGARTVFEEALITMSIWGNGFTGLSYMTPVVQLALADILWTATDGDRGRARRLVTRAIAGFTRLGAHRAAGKASAEKWLADHPL